MNYILDKHKAHQKWILFFRNGQLLWFNELFESVIEAEGWYLNNHYTDYMEVCLTENSNITLETAIEYAKQYGWVLSDTGNVIDFNIDNLIRNRHLLTGKDLGLL